MRKSCCRASSPTTWICSAPNRPSTRGLLTPQGKILFDFLVVKADGGFLLDVARDKAADLVKRLSLYKLRAKVEIRDASGELVVFAMWGDNPTSNTRPDVLDPRLACARHSLHCARGRREGSRGRFERRVRTTRRLSRASYCARRAGRRQGLRLRRRVPARSAVRPAPRCSRSRRAAMSAKRWSAGWSTAAPRASGWYRSWPKRRCLRREQRSRLAINCIGTLGSSAGNRGLALLRLDRAAEMKTKGADLMAGPVKVEIELPPWAKFARAPADHP